MRSQVCIPLFPGRAQAAVHCSKYVLLCEQMDGLNAEKEIPHEGSIIFFRLNIMINERERET